MADLPPQPDVQETDAVGGVQVPDVVGRDLRRAFNALERAGFVVDVSALSKSERGYATRYQTHPRVRVVEMDPLPGTLVEEGTTIAILEAECPRDSIC
ncbi:MAG: PASTA domain-containing protein [Actinobacteria bacterium]|nr:PASTA domain-containing protein [Actinomycetota bacterium]